MSGFNRFATGSSNSTPPQIGPLSLQSDERYGKQKVSSVTEPSLVRFYDPNRGQLHMCSYASVEHRRPPFGPTCLQVPMLSPTNMYHRG